MSSVHKLKCGGPEINSSSMKTCRVLIKSANAKKDEIKFLNKAIKIDIKIQNLFAVFSAKSGTTSYLQLQKMPYISQKCFHQCRVSVPRYHQSKLTTYQKFFITLKRTFTRFFFSFSKMNNFICRPPISRCHQAWFSFHTGPYFPPKVPLLQQTYREEETSALLSGRILLPVCDTVQSLPGRR